MFWLQVSDNGLGIPADEQDRIFDSFYRVPQQGLAYEGMGLGLAIVRDLVQAHHGQVVVSSELGQGSQFTIFFPLSSAN